LSPGPGFGGSCFPKDTRAVASIAAEQGRRFRIIEAVLEVNDATKERMVAKIENAFDGVNGKTLAVLGLSFKPETDDVRESPALTVVEGLLAGGAHLRAFDPAASAAFRDALEVAPEAAARIHYCDSAYDAADGADGLVILTEWNQFRALELDELAERLRAPLVVDLRNLYEPTEMAAAGFRYVSIGRPEGRPDGDAAPGGGDR
jgi:UDPglucose 6-dehydrogenase